MKQIFTAQILRVPLRAPSLCASSHNQSPFSTAPSSFSRLSIFLPSLQRRLPSSTASPRQRSPPQSSSFNFHSPAPAAITSGFLQVAVSKVCNHALLVCTRLASSHFRYSPKTSQELRLAAEERKTKEV